MKVAHLLFTCALLCIFTACSKKREEISAEGLTKIRVQLDWFPEPEHGGLYQALAKGYFKDEGLEVELVSGGSNVMVSQVLASGKADMAQIASSTLISAVEQGMPIRYVATAFQKVPTVLMLHASNPISTFEELDGKTIMGRLDSLYAPYLKDKYDIDFQMIPQSFSLSQFLSDPEFIQEGFYIAEFYFIEKEGVKPKALYLWDSGFINTLGLAVNEGFYERHPEAVKGFVRAFKKGWREYHEGDPTPAHEALKKASREISRELSDDFLDYCRNLIVRDRLAVPGNGWHSYGDMDVELLQAQIRQMEAAGRLKPGAVTIDDITLEEFFSLSE